MTKTITKDGNKAVMLITPLATAINPNLAWHEESNDWRAKGRYTLTLEFDHDQLKSWAEVQEAIAYVMPEGGKSPLDEWEGTYRLKAKTRHPIKAINLEGKEIYVGEIEDGDEVRVALKVASAGLIAHEGVAVYLQAVQLLEEREGSRSGYCPTCGRAN